jgi:hypothetical protein
MENSISRHRAAHRPGGNVFSGRSCTEAGKSFEWIDAQKKEMRRRVGGRRGKLG